MMVGEEYKASLFDGRATYFEGERVEDLLGHTLLGIAVGHAVFLNEMYTNAGKYTGAANSHADGDP